jgi:putative tricarboxylic transport membrane protein
MTAAIALFVFGAATVALALQLPLGTLRMPGTGFFPLVLGLLLVALAAAQGVRLFLAKAPAPAAAAPAPPPDGATRRVALFIGVIALATLLLQPAGYVVATLVLMVGLLRALGVAWGACALIAASSAVASHFVFVRWLGIPMPAGPLGF